jgi:hypothetical protein
MFIGKANCSVLQELKLMNEAMIDCLMKFLCITNPAPWIIMFPTETFYEK